MCKKNKYLNGGKSAEIEDKVDFDEILRKLPQIVAEQLNANNAGTSENKSPGTEKNVTKAEISEENSSKVKLSGQKVFIAINSENNLQ